jgi:hypothetical protein
LIRSLFLGEGGGSGARIEGLRRSKAKDLWRTYGARDKVRRLPALAGWVNVWRAYGARVVGDLDRQLAGGPATVDEDGVAGDE